jgi:hypothetical protein
MKKVWKITMWVLVSLVTVLALNFAPMLSLRTPAMERRTVHGIELWAVSGDAEEVGRIADRIHSQSGGVLEAMGYEQGEGLGVIIYPDRAALKRKTLGLAGMLLLPDWFIGRNTQEYVLIASPAAHGPAHTRESVEQAAVHEYVHLLTDRRNRRLGYWLKEGFALYLAEQEPATAALRQHRDITWEEFSRPSALQFAEVGGYHLAYHMMEYLTERYGWERVLELTEPGASWERVLGANKRTVFGEWRRSLAEL